MTGSALPRPLLPFVEFATLLRANGFPIAPEQTQSFIAAVGLLGPRSLEDVHRAAIATLAPSLERREEFDALFRLLFLGQGIAAPAAADDEEEMQVYDEQDGGMEPPEPRKPRNPAARRLARSASLRANSTARRSRSPSTLPPPRARELPHRRSRRFGPSKGAAAWICAAACAPLCGGMANCCSFLPSPVASGDGECCC